MVKFYCEVCDKHQTVQIEPLIRDELNPDLIWGDIVCLKCYFVIATISAEKEGRYGFTYETNQKTA